MESYGKHNNADGRGPYFGAIFMTSSATKRECFERGLFALSSYYCRFIKQIQAGMILFLFDHEKRELHGVYKSCSDGGINIVPGAFSSSGKQFPAQVKFISIWNCKPLKENEFCDAIKENYFSAKKFHFGLSEKQVCRLLSLFSERKLDLELPGRQLAGMKDMKPESYPVDRIGRSVDARMHVGIVKNELDAVTDTLPFKNCDYRGDSFLYKGENNDIGLNRSGILGSKRRGDVEIGLDSSSGHVSDYLDLKDHWTDMQFRSTVPNGLSGGLSGAARVWEDDILRVGDGIMSENITNSAQRMVLMNDRPDMHNSDFNQSLVSNKPMLNHDSLVQNQLRTTCAMLHPIKVQISDNLCAAQGDLNSRSFHSYDPDVPNSDLSHPSFVRMRVDDSSKSILESASPSNNYRRNSIYSLSDQPPHMHMEQRDTNQFQVDSYGPVNHVPYESNRTSMPFYATQNSEQSAAKIFEHEGHDCFPLKYSSVPPSPLNIANHSWETGPHSSLYQKYISSVSNDAHSIALQENLGHEVAQQKNNETYSPAVPWENEGHAQVQFGDPLIHEHDLDYECCQNSGSSFFDRKSSGSSKSGYKNKNSVFSRLSFVQGINNRGHGSNNLHREHHVCPSNSVDEVMEMVRQSHKQRMIKGKLKPMVKHSKVESSKDKKQHISSSRLKLTSSDKSLDDTNMDTTTSNEGKTHQIAEDTGFVDFKRRSQVRKINEETEIRGSKETSKSEDVGIVQQKKRKLIRPNFTKSATSDNKDINLGASQNLQVPLSQESSKTQDDSEGCNALAQSEEENRKDGEDSDLVRQKQLEDKGNNATGCMDCQGGGKQIDGQFIHNIGFNDGPECPENLNSKNASSSVSCEAKSLPNKEGGLCTKNDTKPISSDSELQNLICKAHKEDKDICGGTSTNIGVIKDGSESSQNLANENALTTTRKEINTFIEKASNMHSEMEKALPSITDNVDMHCSYFEETAIGSKMADSKNSCLNSVAINATVEEN
ncbi:B2 protein [Senna tora]|uniref:B2 protein n=1 Tax=Senna tora TaxID=362788 RepID=A0A835CIJ3_9FABA|nr:B2 protein [Senna tora]